MSKSYDDPKELSLCAHTNSKRPIEESIIVKAIKVLSLPVWSINNQGPMELILTLF